MANAEVGAGSQRASTFANGVNSLDLAYPGNVASGNLLVCAGQAYNSSTGPTSVAVTDSIGTTYTVKSFAPSSGAPNERIWIAYGIAPSSGANTVTVNPSNASDDLSFSIDEFSGVDTTTPLDVDGSYTQGTGTTASDSITTTVDGALIVGVMGYDGSTVTLSPGSGWTEIGEHEDNTTDEAHAAAFQIVGAAGSYTASWTLGALRVWQAMTLSFKPSAGSVPTLSAATVINITATGATPRVTVTF